MSVQFITDSDGRKTGVIIPFEAWETLLRSNPQRSGSTTDDCPEWHKKLGRAELEKVHAGTAGRTTLREAAREMGR